MAFRYRLTAAFLAALALSGCNMGDGLFPSLTPDASSGKMATNTPPSLGSSTFSAPAPTPGAATGTFVGAKVMALRDDLGRLQQTLNGQSENLQQIRMQTVTDSSQYHGIVAAINARLQVGTTPGNPVLAKQWDDAQLALDRIGEDVQRMNRLSTEVASTSGMAAYLLDTVRAARFLPGAVDEDHRQLRVLEDETNATTVQIERLLHELSSDVQRQQQYISSERSNLNTQAVAIKNGQLYGGALVNPRADLGGSAAPATALAPGERPLITIRFDRPNTNYENALYTAVKGALDRRPNASFEVMAVSPVGGSSGSTALGETASRRNAESVVRSLTQMGLPPSRIRSSATTSGSVASGEVWIFVR